MVTVATVAHRSGLRIGVATAVTTALAVGASYLLPDSAAAAGVAFCFLAAVYVLVLRDDPTTFERVRYYGLALGGLLERRALDGKQLATDTGRAMFWALVCCAFFFPKCWLGFVWWCQPATTFAWVGPGSVWDEWLGQFLVIALPEEAFYRGYLQTSLDRLWESKPGGPRRHVRILGADVGWALPVTSAVFALGHFLTHVHPDRLAVFCPSLVFGWLRLRTGGIGAAVIFHACANIFSATLARGYGL